MANFTEPANPTFVGVRQIETNDPVLGGATEIGGNVNSPVNYALEALVERTAKLKEDVEAVDIPAATRTTAGVARLATVAQVTAGTNDDRIVTPLLLQGKVDDIPSAGNASTSTRGLIEIANNSEADAGNDTQRAMTSALVKRRIDAKIVQRTQAQYDAITNPVSNILYAIVG